MDTGTPAGRSAHKGALREDLATAVVLALLTLIPACNSGPSGGGPVGAGGEGGGAGPGTGGLRPGGAGLGGSVGLGGALGTGGGLGGAAPGGGGGAAGGSGASGGSPASGGAGGRVDGGPIGGTPPQGGAGAGGRDGGTGGAAGTGGGAADGPRADAPPTMGAGVSVLTNRYDNTRSAANTRETILTTTNVRPGQFGLLFSRQYEGNAYAQPLYVSGLTIKGAQRNVVFVATSTNWVYAFDADDPAATLPLWSRQLAPPGEIRVGGTNPNTILGQTWCRDMFPFVGVAGTPVIDPASNRLYVVSKEGKIGSAYTNKLHALDLATGDEAAGSPVVVAASVAGTGAGTSGGRVSLDGWKHFNRAGLLLANGTLYVAFTSHCDDNPYHGWVLAYDPASLRQTSVFNTTPDGIQGGIWQSGVGLSANANGVFFVVGNGTATADGKGLGTSVVRLNANNTLADWFTPSNVDALNRRDADLTSGALLVGNYVLGGGKEGVLYVIDQMNMTHFNVGSDRIPQALSIRDPGVTSGGHLHSMVFWNNRVYVWPEEHGMKAYSFTNGRLSAAPVAEFTGIQTKHPGAIMSISANGTTAGTGIVWGSLGTTGDAWHDIAGGTLVAVDAMSGAKLWDSGMNAADRVGNFAKFSVPVVANGKVYLTTFANVNTTSPSYLRVYGLKP